MPCSTVACEGFVKCDKPLNCPVGRCLAEYVPPANLPPAILTDAASMSFHNQASGSPISVMEYSITVADEEIIERVAGIPWRAPRGITSSMYMMNVNLDTREVLTERETLTYGGETKESPVIIFFQDPETRMWWIWQCEYNRHFGITGYDTSREYVTVLPLLIKVGDDWVLNRGEDVETPCVFTDDATPTLYNNSCLFYLWDDMPATGEFASLYFGRSVAIQSVDIVVNSGCGEDPLACTANSWLAKGNDQLFGEDYCLSQQPIMLTYARSELRRIQGRIIGTGDETTPAPCTNIDCANKCMMFYFMITEKTGCLPARVNSGRVADKRVRNFMIVVGVLIGVFFILCLMWIVVWFVSKKQKLY